MVDRIRLAATKFRISVLDRLEEKDQQHMIPPYPSSRYLDRCETTIRVGEDAGLLTEEEATTMRKVYRNWQPQSLAMKVTCHHTIGDIECALFIPENGGSSTYHKPAATSDEQREKRRQRRLARKARQQ